MSKCLECQFHKKVGRFHRCYSLLEETGERMSYETVMNDIPCRDFKKIGITKTAEKTGTRSHNVGASDYALHKIQPWDIWIEYKLNPFDADIVKRILRKKAESGKSEKESRRLDYEKIIHICQERIRQIDEGIEL